MKDNLSPYPRTIAINSLVLSSINNGIKVWGLTNAAQLQRVQKVQNFGAKVALGGGAKRDHATPFLKKLGRLRIENKYKYKICIMVYNILNENIPNYILSLKNDRDIRSLPTRQQNQLYVPHTNTSTGARSALVAAPHLWNSLPASVRNPGTTFSFKR